METIVKLTLRIPDQKTLSEVLALAPGARLNCGAPHADGQGHFLVDLYATPADAEQLSGTPYVVEIDKDYGQALQHRQSQVGQGDRFKGGTVAPTGLGATAQSPEHP